MPTWLGTGQARALRTVGSYLQVEPVELDGVLAADLALHGRVDALEVGVDGLLRVGPGRDAMREVVCPHEVVLAVDRRRQDARAVVLKGEEDVALQILAGQLLVQVAVGVVAGGAAKLEIGKLVDVGHPADVELGAYDLQVRVAVEDAGED